MKPTLKYAEIMASYACTLSCEGCTNYSNYNYSGFPDWSKTLAQMKLWCEVLDFESFGIIGGEPLLNPNLSMWMLGLRELMPDTKLSVITNGTRLKKLSNILKIMADCKNVTLTVVPHLNADKIRGEVESIVKRADSRFEMESSYHKDDIDGANQRVDRFWLNEYNILVKVLTPPPRVFVKSYQGFGASMLPWNHADPQRSIEICPCRYCPLIYEGRIYKCSQIALLADHLAKCGLLESKEWEPYLAYKGYSPTDSLVEIENFVNSFGIAESICQMCPAKKGENSVVDHLSTVKSKKEWIRIHDKKWPPVN